MTTIPKSLLPLVSNKFEIGIPKIIHQTYKSVEQIPGCWKDSPNSWISNHPTWTYKFWSDADCRKLVNKYFPKFLPVFDGYKHNIQRADAIRPILMYVYGGWYCDMDIACKKPIDDLFYNVSDECYLILTPNTQTITNCIMASKPKCQFWLKVIDEMSERFYSPRFYWVGKHIEVMQTTGPMMLHTVYHRYKNNYKIGMLFKEYLLPSECSSCSKKPCSNPLSYTVLLEGSSWCDLDSKIYNIFLCNWLRIVLCGVLIMFLYVSVCSVKYA